MNGGPENGHCEPASRGRSNPPSLAAPKCRRGIASALGLAMTALAVVAAGLLAATLVFILIPLPGNALDLGSVVSLRVEDRSGGLLREVRSTADGRSARVDASRLPTHVVAAFLAAEDKRFFSHHGVDAIAIARAAWQDLRARRIVSGGSTITQQLARDVFGRGHGITGKIGEALWALRLEAHLSKNAILSQYLTRVPLGNELFGVEAASQAYFGRSAEHLSVAQAALLASLPKGPTVYDPYRYLDRLRGRQAWVLERMAASRVLSWAEASRLKDAPLDLRVDRTSWTAPHFVNRVVASLPSETAIARCITTLDPELQAAAQRIVREELSGLANRRVGSAAVVVLDNSTGEVLAYLGSPDFWDADAQGQNDGVAMTRQPGSALKPFAYGLALSRGYTPATLLSDVETHLSTPTGDYAPRNYDRKIHGPVRLRAALANSYNVPAVRVAEDLGPDAILDVLHRAGFESLTEGPDHYGVGIVLGDGEVSLLEAARGYAGLARGGVTTPLVFVHAAYDDDGHALPLPVAGRPTRFLPKTAVALLTHILSDTSARAPAFGFDNALRLPFPVAAKTGTSKGYSDNWTIGFTRERTVAVWAGNFDGTPMQGVSGITGAAPIFRRVMMAAMKGSVPAPLVDTSRLVHARICPLSGKLAGPACPSAMEEVFAKGTGPTETCPMHRALPVERRTGRIAAHCEGADVEARSMIDVGPSFYGWASTEGIAGGPWAAPDCAPQAPDERDQLVLAMPGDGDEYLLTDDVPPQNQTIPVRVIAPRGVGRVVVETEDGNRIELVPPFWSRVPARPGHHVLKVRRLGRNDFEATARYEVRG
jgi:penicillin-binding protein 1C